MGILHSTTRSFNSKHKEEEEEEEEEEKEEEGQRQIHLDLQNHCRDSAERSPKLLILRISIYKAIKGLLRKVGSIFSLAKLRKAADPLLPVQDPARTEPLLLQTPPISSPITTCDDEESEYCEDDVGRVLLWEYEERCDHHHVVVSIPGFTCDKEEEEEEEEEEAEEAEGGGEGEGEEGEEKEKEKERKEEEEEERRRRRRRKRRSRRGGGGGGEEEEIQRVVVVREERWIKHYSSRHRILLVGEGDFSFSACLAVKFLWAPNIIATSLDSQAFLKENYSKALKNIEELKSRGSRVMHGINVSSMAKHQVLGHLRFDRIIFNFPYAGLRVVKDMPRQSQLRHHQRLVREFMENAKEMISEEGEIHITHKTNGFHGEWRLVSLARREGLRLIEAVKFNLLDYPGYYVKCGFGGNNFFNCNPSKTYKFELQ